MLIVGFIKTDRPEVLINPVVCKNEVEVYTWLASFFNDENFRLDSPLTQLKVNQALEEKVLIQIAIAGHDVAIVFGEQNVIKRNIERSFHTELFDYKDFMAK
ncbi:hypothetical protein HH214_21425 (plasmid) [Mucilaginibacter robiniae]|uniref:Uncharacterized protein n=1 Tax=Mucilaginibacter robiniae TaxID=2728022 RepID=A0A7L5E5C5_9SPHI|nr:hypothetical protein [Mucilaginibacter robiniae]QJD98520.1 hypothetical protein HH214_21425 [Mucilaginibacter robiniae]